MKRMGYRLAAAAVAAVLAVGSSGCRVGNEEVTISRGMADDEVFLIDGKVCTLPVMKLLLMNNMNLHGESYGIDLLQNEDLKVQKKFEQYVKKISMDEITRVYSMVALANAQGVTLTDEQKELAQWAGEDCFQSLTDEEVAYLNISQENVQDIYEKYALADKLYQSLVQDVNEEVSDDEARVMEVRQIYTTNEEQARKALADLEAETEFSTVAANYNEADEISLTLQRGMLPEEAETVVFSMEDGEISDLIETDQGYYIFCCDNKFDEEQTQIHKQDIVEQRKQEAFHSVYDPFVETIHSKLNESVWDDLSVREMEKYSFADFDVMYEKYLGKEIMSEI
ncbi:MAG: peptidylprolyl isomerase [Lachnospiraceae bacterium]|nr:peptidylprolyl isomerase [Lachnospiraceae bacterium]